MTPLLLKFFAISDEAKHLVLIMVLINNAITLLPIRTQDRSGAD